MNLQGDAWSLYGLAVTMLDATTLPQGIRLDGALKMLDQVRPDAVPADHLWDRHVRLMLAALQHELHQREVARRIERELRSIHAALAGGQRKPIASVEYLLAPDDQAASRRVPGPDDGTARPDRVVPHVGSEGAGTPPRAPEDARALWAQGRPGSGRCGSGRHRRWAVSPDSPPGPRAAFGTAGS
ncbi:MAG: hypothetical protein AB7T63_04230 [Planctomycetota bacterium]